MKQLGLHNKFRTRPIFWMLLIVCTLLTMVSACVSVTLKTESSKPAEGYSFKEPVEPFLRAKDKTYPSWIQNKTGSIISLVSECGSQESTLAELQRDTIGALDEAALINEEKISYNNCDTLKSIIRGKTNGIDTQLMTLIFKKSNCNYIVSFGGRSKSFNQDLAAFNAFLENLKVP